MGSGILLLAGLGLFALGSPACSNDGDGAASTTAPSAEVTEDPAERLYGTWDVSAVRSYHTWEPDGTWYVAAATGGDPYDFGTYTVDGSIVTLNTEADSPECPGTTGNWEVTFIDADTISWEVIDDECASRGLNVPQTLWERVEAE
jgi:hypothetical protein